MARPYYVNANLEIAQHTFGHLVSRVNQIIADMGTVVLTSGPVSQPNTTNGALTVGNTHLQGVLSALTIVAPVLRGGTVSVPAGMNVVSNATFTGVETRLSSHVYLGAAASENIYIAGRVASNITPNADLSYDLGSSTIAFRDGFLRNVRANTFIANSGVVSLTGTINTLESVSTTTAHVPLRLQLRSTSNTHVVLEATGTNIRPSANSVTALGEATRRFTSVFSSGLDVAGAGYITGVLALGSGSLTTVSTTVNLFDTAANTVNAFGVASIINLGKDGSDVSLGKTGGTNRLVSKGSLTIGALGTGGTLRVGVGTETTATFGGATTVTTFAGTTESSARTNGSVVFLGGVGVDKNLNVGGQGSFGSLSSSGNASFSSNVAVSGTVRVASDLHVDGKIYSNSAIEMVYASSITDMMQIRQNLILDGPVQGHVLPSANNTYDVGSVVRAWRSVMAGGLSLVAGTFTYSVTPPALTANRTLTLPNGNVILRPGSTIVTTDKITALTTGTSAEYFAKVSDPTGTGQMVFATSPTLSDPRINTQIRLEASGAAITTLQANAVANNVVTLPTANGQLALVSELENLNSQARATLTLTSGSGITVSGGPYNTNSNTVFTVTNTDRGSSQSIFKQIANASGVVSFSANNNSDTIRFSGGAHTTVTLSPATKSIDISSNLSAGDGIVINANSDISVATTVLRTSRLINTGTGLSGGGDLTIDRTIEFNTVWGDARYALSGVTITGAVGGGISGGGNLASSKTLSLDSTVVRTSGPQTIAGVKTFDDLWAVKDVGVVNNLSSTSSSFSFWDNGKVKRHGLIESTLDGALGIYNRNAADTGWAASIVLGQDGVVTFGGAGISGNGSRITSLNASSLATGTVPDARLPASMAGKTFTSAISITGTLSATGALNTSSDVINISNDSNKALYFRSAAGVIRGSTHYNATSGNVSLYTYGTGGAITSNASLTPGGQWLVSILDAATRIEGKSGDTAAAPSYTWTGDTNTGMYRPAADVIAFSSSGVERGRINSTGFMGNGSQITALNATNLSSGTVADARLSTNIPRLNAAADFSGTITSYGLFIQPSGTGNSAIRGRKMDGDAIFDLIGQPNTNLTILRSFNQASTSYKDFTFNGSDGVLTAVEFSGAHSGNGSALTSLNAGALTTGTVAKVRLPTDTMYDGDFSEASIRTRMSTSSPGTVGTYAFLGIQAPGEGVVESPGDTRAGSDLYYTSGSGRGTSSAFALIQPGGTWRCMGLASTYDGGVYGGGMGGTQGSLGTLWLRIS